MLGTAIALAAERFKHSKDKGGKPYILHCLYVMDNTTTSSEDVKIAAVLHDVIEDTATTLEDLKNIGFSTKSINLIDILTHRITETYDEYIDRVSLHPDATNIKKADLAHNASILRIKGIREKDLERIKKYHKSYYKLKNN